MKVLLIAESASPETVSVPLVGWSQAMAIRERLDCLIATQIRHRRVFLDHGLQEGRDFIAIDSEPVARPAWRLGNLLRGGSGKGWTTAMAVKLPGYLYFERVLWRTLRDRLKAGEFDLVHRITPLSPTMPSPIARHCRRIGVPFVLGPLNGGVPWPKGYQSARVKEREWLSFVRDAYRLVPGHGSTRRCCAALIGGSIDTLEREPAFVRERAFHIPENAVDPSRFSVRRQPRSIDQLRLVFVGRLVPYKGCDILLEAAIPLLKAGQARLTIVGDGPQRPELEQIVAREGLRGQVDFRGWVAHPEVAPLIAASDVFAFPSIREFGGAVAIEAMAAGVPPMVVAYGGLAETVTEEVGYPVTLGSRTELVDRFRERLTEVAADPVAIDRKGEAGLRRVREHFTWDAKASQVLRVYDWVLNGTTCPHAFVPMDSGPEARLRRLLPT
jgi:glycosyltransferase involved in cell wall biosynthesis